jgi:hypothetical protein
VRWWHLLWVPCVSGCYTQQGPDRVQQVYLKVVYDPAAARWAEGAGENTVEGSALLRTRGGDLRTCAGEVVYLTPVTTYAKERMMYLFGNVRSGFHSVDEPIEFVPESATYEESARTTKCDPQGTFSFDDLPDGEWFVTTIITWEVREVLWSDSVVLRNTGGLLMQRVRAKDGDTKRVVLSY